MDENKFIAENPTSTTSEEVAPRPKREAGGIPKILGFTRTYNALLFFTFGGALFAFCISRLPLLDVDGFYKRNGGKGEYFFMRRSFYKAGFIVHLIGILFANILAVLQFVPKIRHKFLILHRINGYSIFLLYSLGAVGGFIITTHAYGGHIDTQTAAGALAILVLVAFTIAWVNIKRLQIDQHRKWMLRAINLMASIVTSRIILAIATAIVAKIGTFAESWDCSQLQFTVNDDDWFHKTYPLCATNSHTIVIAGSTAIESKASAARAVFGMSLWLAVAVHIILMEFFIHFTPGESERLRQISYEKQLQRGFPNPGSSGITSDLFSSEKWMAGRVHTA